MDDNAEIVAGLRRGDPGAFEAAVSRYERRLWAFLCRLCGRREVADELLQETFLRLARGARQLREDTVLSAWLFTVARNLARSHARWSWLDGVRLAELAAKLLSREEQESPLQQLAASESARRAERALAEMSTSSREVALLVWIEQMSPSEAASVLGIRPEAARQRLARARQHMEQALGGMS